MKYSTKLRKWSRLIKVRDQATCYMCGLKLGLGEVEAHHIFPKAKFPELALELSNGICLCWKCHRPIVHKGKYKDYEHCERYVPMFETVAKATADWNAENQERLA